MYFRVSEVFDYAKDHYVYTIYREGYALKTNVEKIDVENFVMDRTILHDTDLINYEWGHLGTLTGKEAREILSKKDAVPALILTSGQVGSIRGTLTFP